MLTSIVIPDSVTSIGDYSFSDCVSLTSISIPEDVTSVGRDAFEGCCSLTNITIPDSVSSIGFRAFYNCRSLTSIVIPEGVTSIEAETFAGCRSLTGITIPESVTSIGPAAFSGCSSLTSITIPEGVTGIERETFSGCSSLTSIAIPESVTSIERAAFSGCSNLANITIPEGVTSIGEVAFSNCNSLTSLTIPEGVTSIEGYTFQGCSGLTSVTIANGVTSIGGYAFYGCSGLTSITIPESVTNIGDYAFGNCASLHTVYIPDSVVSVANSAFNKAGIQTVYTTPGSYASTLFPSYKVKYLCDPADDKASHYINFKSDSIVMKESSTLTLSQYLLTDLNEAEYTVELSDENLFMYDSGVIASLGSGECDITVRYGDQIVTARLIAQDGDFSSAESISFADSDLSLIKGNSAVNTVALLPSNADASDIEWSTSDDSIVTVNNGVIKAVGAGTATVSAYSKTDNSIKAECEVTVTVPLHDLILIGDTPVLLDKGTSKKVSYYKYPSDATNVEVSFTSSDPSVVEIDETGKMTAKNFGAADITVAAGDITKTMQVKVYRPLAGITLDQKSAQVKAKETLQLNVIYEPEDTTERVVVWASNKESVATVDENGLVTAHGKGIATITATAGEYSASCTIVCPNVPMTGIQLPNTVELKYGQSTAQELTFIPVTTTDDKTATWSSSDPSIFTVSQDGVITPTGLGTATLTATVGEYSATSEITVIKGLPVFNTPEGITASCNQQLSEIVLPEGFAWANTSQSVGDSGSKVFAATFTPADQDHYVTVNDVMVPVSVEHSYAEEWSKNEETHWHECTCGDKYEEAEHTYGDWIETAAPTCTEAGEKERTCTVCGYVEKGTVEPAGHDWFSDYTVDTEPTCTGTGSKSIHCKTCDEIKPESQTEIPALGHSYAKTVIAPTCSQDGYTLHVCGRCGDSYQDNETTATGHDFGEWIIDTDSSCTAEGIQHRECKTCGYTETKGVDKKEHAFANEYTVDKAATCTTDGSKSYHCTNAGCTATTGSVVILAEGHHFSQWEVKTEATCTEAGELYHTCDVCGTEESINLPATGHQWLDKEIVDKEATCAEAGSKSIHCKVCDEVRPESQIEIPAKGHSYGSWEVTKEPTCTDEGERMRTCTICGGTQTEVIVATGHHYSETVIAPSCSQNGYTLHVCGGCGDSYQDNETAATGHTFGDWTVDTDSSCTEEGIQHRECETCGYTETKGVSKKDHVFANEYTVDKEATCTTDGSKSYHCLNEGCTATTGSVVIPADGHQYSAWNETKRPTCTESGDAERVCSVCGEKETIHFEARGHVWTEWTVTKEPTCTEQGSKERKCAVCGDTETVTIDATGHDWAEEYTVDKEPTYTEEGSESLHCIICGMKKEGTERAIAVLPIPVDDAKVTLPHASMTYTGKALTQEPTVVVTSNGETKTLTKDTDYTVSYKNNINIGTASVVITGKGNYTGTVTKTFQIKAASGWVKEDVNWYYYNASGVKATGWQKVGGVWYYMDSAGVMQTGWEKIGGRWYYFNSSGAMQTGWQKISGSWYYFNSSGSMGCSEWRDGYWLNANGTWTYQPKGSWKKSGGRWWFGDTSGWYAKSTTIWIDGSKYSFDASGWLK